jgi:hypothetical protein
VLIDKSESGHCCFRYSIVDMNKPIYDGGGKDVIGHEVVCECFEKEYAELIMAGLPK